jgi:hypothetical protein
MTEISSARQGPPMRRHLPFFPDFSPFCAHFVAQSTL